MDFIKNINSNSLIICSEGNKEILLNELNKYNKLFPIKIMSLSEFLNSYCFSYDNETIYNVISKYDVKYDIAKTYIENLMFVEDKNYNNKKLDRLVQIKNYLLNKNLLKKSNYFIHNLNNLDIYFYKFDYINNFTQNIINKLKNVNIIEKKYNNYKHFVYEFNHIEEEIDYVASSICELINNNIDINKIKLTNISEEYIPIIKRVFSFYKIPINLSDEPFLYETLPSSYLLENFSSNLNDVIETMQNKFDSNIVSQLINIINRYTFIDDKNLVKDMIISDLLNTRVKANKLSNAIEIINYDDSINDDEYVFMVNFNQKSIPKIYKDEKYLSDKELSILGLETSIELTKVNKEITISNIKSIKNLIITYKKQSYFDEYFPSNLIDEMNLEVKKITEKLNYSSLANKIKLCKDLDNYYKYNVKSNRIQKLIYNYDIPYKTYNNKYKKINIDSFNNIMSNKLSLSYSSMQAYNECSFKYYINNILKLDVYEDTFSAFIGTLFHHILEIGIKNEINVKEEINKFLNFSDRKFNYKEYYYIDKLTSDITFALETIKKQLEYSKYTDILTENKVSIEKNGRVSVVFKGFIDKSITYNDGEKTYVVLIDYKTYDVDIKMNLIDYGLNLQLPIYLYLANNKLKNVEFIGFYIQKILPSNIKYDEAKSIEKQKRDFMKLSGYSNSNKEILSIFDKNYASSEIIKGMKINNDGNFSSSANILSTEEMNEIITKVDFQVDKCIDNILNANFDINPKSLNTHNISCTYCKYKDLCYMTQKDIIDIVLQEDDVNDTMD